jgi:hypothetical protein
MDVNRRTKTIRRPAVALSSHHSQQSASNRRHAHGCSCGWSAFGKFAPLWDGVTRLRSVLPSPLRRQSERAIWRRPRALRCRTPHDNDAVGVLRPDIIAPSNPFALADPHRKSRWQTAFIGRRLPPPPPLPLTLRPLSTDRPIDRRSSTTRGVLERCAVVRSEQLSTGPRTTRTSAVC